MEEDVRHDVAVESDLRGRDLDLFRSYGFPLLKNAHHLNKV